MNMLLMKCGGSFAVGDTVLLSNVNRYQGILGTIISISCFILLLDFHSLAEQTGNYIGKKWLFKFKKDNDYFVVEEFNEKVMNTDTVGMYMSM